MSPYLKDLWIGAIWGGTKLIWHARNKKTFKDHIITMDKKKRKWSKLFHDTAFLSKGRMYNNQSNLGILRSLGLPLHPSKSAVIKTCSWELPGKGEIKINTDGAARGNLGKGGIGCIFRDCKGNVLGTLAKGLGLVTNYTAECQAIIHEVASAASNGWLIAWVESDSKAAVEAFNSDNIPWNLETEWGNAKKSMKQIRISSNWREANFSADKIAKRGAHMHDGLCEIEVGRPAFLRKIEVPMQEYFRFC
ncbi:hypothetical protein GIB67_000840 [Kingdonia uniflora]|uniref:RNase H type-1 domain-containing protein n=1 Tax=Kingdonia uniflora TaxID=39325 RepID=A0A7J7NQS3_9MAGN|nr:hypothetical protein GIB67_000840 [Kingdonia uniflora]